MTSARPPRIARGLLRIFLEADVRAWTVADTDHRYAVLYQRDGPVLARRWYRRQTWHAARVALRRPFVFTAPFHTTSRNAAGYETLSTLGRDVRHAVRTWSKNPGFTAVALITLGLGVGANTALFNIINGVLLRPLPFEQSQELVFIAERSLEEESESGQTSAGTFLDWREQNHTFTDMTIWGYSSFILETEDDAVALTGVLSYPNFFAVLGIRPRLGRPYTMDDVAEGRRGAVAVISHSLWQERWGSDPSVVGRVIRVDGAPTEVIGVMPARVAVPEPDIDIWVPAKFVSTNRWMRHNRWLQAVARTRPEITIDQARADMARVSAGLASGEYSDIYQGWGAELTPLQEQIVGNARPALLLAFGAVSLVLLIACANVASMLMARATVRHQEMAVRAALGARRSRLVQQLLTESIVLGAGGGTVGAGVAFVVHYALLALQPGIIPRADELALDAPALWFALVVSLLTGLLFGVAPALRGGRINLRQALTDGSQDRGTTVGTRRQRQRGVLVALQMAVTVVLLSSAAVLIQTMLTLGRVDPGFRAEGAVAVRHFLDRGRYNSDSMLTQYALEFEAALASLPGATSTGGTSALPMDPLGINYDLPYRIPGNEDLADTELPQADYRIVTPGYFQTMGIPILRGRSFTARDDAGSPFVILVNQTMADQVWGGQDPIGQRIYTPSRDWTWFEVVGVVGNTRYYGLNAAPRPEMYVPFAQQPTEEMTFVVHTRGDPALITEPVRRAALTVDPGQPAHSVVLVPQLIADTLATERFYGTVLIVFASVALTLSAVGVYGVLSYWVSQRRQEIGVRLALGATRRGVMGTVIRQGMGATAVGATIGLAGAVVVTRAMQSAIASTQSLGLPSVLAVLLTLGIVAAAACVVPAFQASSVDPMRALRG